MPSLRALRPSEHVQLLKIPEAPIGIGTVNKSYVVGDRLDDKAIGQLDAIVEYAPMRNREGFDLGSIAQVWHRIIERKRELIVFRVDTTILPPESLAKRHPIERPIYFITPPEMKDYATSLVEDAVNPAKLRLVEPGRIMSRLVEPIQVRECVFGLLDQKWDGKRGGWLEMENGFMFFSEEQLFRNMARYFGIKDLSAAETPPEPGGGKKGPGARFRPAVV